MSSLRECIASAANKKIALGHFNVSTLDGIWAVADAGHELNVPVIIGVSEGELGFIGTSSKVLDAIPAGAVVGLASMTKPEDALRFVTETGVDLLAPAVGNIHGVVRGGDPALNIGRIAEISQAIHIPMVLHGASGNSAEDIGNAIKAGIAMVHVSTELRLAYRAGLVKSLSENPDEVAGYKYLKPAKLAMQKVVEEKLRIVNGL